MISKAVSDVFMRVQEGWRHGFPLTWEITNGSYTVRLSCLYPHNEPMRCFYIQYILLLPVGLAWHNGGWCKWFWYGKKNALNCPSPRYFPALGKIKVCSNTWCLFTYSRCSKVKLNGWTSWDKDVGLNYKNETAILQVYEKCIPIVV